MLNDLRHAARMLLHAKGWTAVVVVLLALGIGANTALFSAVNGLLLKELPVQDPDTLVRVRFAGPNQMSTSSTDYGFSGYDESGRQIRTAFSYPMYEQFVADNRTLTDLFACAPFGRVNVVVGGHAEIATAFMSTGNYYRVLGVQTPRGRTILPEDDQPSAPPVAVISDRYWRTRFGGDPNAVGKTVIVNTVPVTIVGILPSDFVGVQNPLGEPADVSVSLALDALLNVTEQRLHQPTYWWLQIMGRLKPGITAAQVQGNLEGVFRQTARAGLDSYLAKLSERERAMANNRNRSDIPYLRVDSGSRGIYDASATDLRAASILGVVVLLLLLIVCANVANLLLSRATVRQREISVRLSMGATRQRLIGQLLIESLLLAVIGGALGLAIAYWGKKLLPGPPGQATLLDWRVAMFVIAVTAITGIIFGIAPAVRATRIDIASSLKESSRSVARSQTLLSKMLLVVQVAISIVLLVGAGLFLRTLHNLRNVDVGFDPHNVVLFRVNPQLNRYDDKRSAAVYQDLMDRVARVSGVTSVGLSQPALLSGSVNSTSLWIQGRTYAVGQRDSINRLVVSPNFFELMRIPLLLGRGFSERDAETAPKVVVINEAAARKYFPNQNPVGLRLGTTAETSDELEIVGVLRDAKYSTVRDPAPPTMYVPHLQTRTFGPMFAVRTAGDPMSAIGAIREAVRQVDPTLPIMNVSTQMEQVELRFAQERLFAQAYALFGTLALVLAAVGLFGLMSYSVSRRTNEIGIRMALGARRAHVLTQVLRESMILVLAGVAVGVAIATGVSRFVESLLFGVAATDGNSMVTAVVVMVLVAAVAGYLPARRASRVDPMIALRYE